MSKRTSFPLALLLLALATPAFAAPPATGVETTDFGKLADGTVIQKITLTTATASVSIITYGARIQELKVPDKSGTLSDVVLGYDNIAQYARDGNFFGAVVGRYGNRIAKAQFTIDGTTYKTPANNGANTLHGGPKGYDKRVWKIKPADDAKSAKDPSVTLTLHDPDGEAGFPGNVEASVTYMLRGTDLRIDYSATTDKPTVINLTNHSYFNLKDSGKSDTLSHVLTLFADNYTPFDNTAIPTGKIAPVKDTPLDFTKPKAISTDMAQQRGGYDNNFIINPGKQPGELVKAAEVSEPTTGRIMEVWTTQPAVQFYTAGGLNNVKGKNGITYNRSAGLCLETQHYPDSPNHPDFPTTLLKPGETYHQTTEYRFSAK